MRWIKRLLLVALVAYGCWWLWQNNPQVKELVDNLGHSDAILTLEARYAPEQVMEANRKELIKDAQHTFLDPVLEYYPYLLMEVKYLQKDKSTAEGVLLWGLEDGEMVLCTDNWETSHGFEDCIRAGAARNDLRVMNALAEKGSLSQEDLQQELQVESDVLAGWLNSARQKQLVVQRASKWQLHFQQPRLKVAPQTKVSQSLVTKSSSSALRARNRYSSGQIKKVACAAFGSDFAIRSEKQVYLPVYVIKVQNPDGTVYTTHWNALSGKKMKTQITAYSTP